MYPRTMERHESKDSYASRLTALVPELIPSKLKSECVEVFDMLEYSFEEQVHQRPCVPNTSTL